MLCIFLVLCVVCRLYAIACQLSPVQHSSGVEHLETDTFKLHCLQTQTGFHQQLFSKLQLVSSSVIYQWLKVCIPLTQGLKSSATSGTCHMGSNKTDYMGDVNSCHSAPKIQKFWQIWHVLHHFVFFLLCSSKICHLFVSGLSVCL